MRPRARVPLRTLVDGFDNARLRFEAVAGGADADAKFAALFEVVAWGGAIWDWFDKRSSAAVPPEALALWYVRNRVLHYGAEALYQTTILWPQPLILRAPGSALRHPAGGSVLRGPTLILSAPTWRPSRRMPKGTGNRGRRQYDTLFAGQPIVESLRHAAATFRRKTR